MLVSNPMDSPDTRAKAVETKRRNGTLTPAKPWQGGNGRGPSPAQSALHKALGGKMEFVVLTRGLPQESHYAHCYKIDLAFPETGLAVEIDGSTHSTEAQKTLDRKKEEALGLLGWKVLRVSNRQVLRSFGETTALIMSAMSSA